MTCKGKIALVTGCTNGIGKATMYKLLEEGAEVYMLVRRPEYGQELARETDGKYPGHVRKVIYYDCNKLETIEAAITAAETGHLVFATLHTNTAADAVDRIVGSFPAERQPQIRMSLSMTLRAVLAQPSMTSQGLPAASVPACSAAQPE